MRCSTTPKTSSTVRPDAAILARSAALISRIAVGRSAGVRSQCGSSGSVVASGVDDDTVALLLVISPYLK
jgi:hypothetical protein